MPNKAHISQLERRRNGISIRLFYRYFVPFIQIKLTMFFGYLNFGENDFRSKSGDGRNAFVKT